jgi:hypothetical protein
MSVINNPGGGLANPNVALTGIPTAPTAAANTNTTQLATTAFVEAAVGIGSVTDQLWVNNAVVVNPFSFTALVNGVGPVGETTVNGFPLANSRPCMVEIPGNLANASRAVNTIYRNITGYPIYVSIFLQTGTTNVTLTATSDTSISPTTAVYTFGTETGAGSGATANGGALTFFVLPNNYYKVTVSTGSPTVFIWREFICQNGTFTDSGDIVSSPGRSLGTVYQNNTANTLFVFAQITGMSGNGTITGTSDYSPSPSEVIDTTTYTGSSTGPATSMFIVPPYHYYKVTASSGSIAHWHEYTWNIPCTKSQNLFLTTGQGQTRSQYANTMQVMSAGNTVSSQVLQQYINDPFRVRWVSINTTQGNNPTVSEIWADSSMPPFRMLTRCVSSGGSTGRFVRGPIMPGYVYAQNDPGASQIAITANYWWEYQLG